MMALVLTLQTTAAKSYIENIIIATAQESGIALHVSVQKRTLTCIFDERNENLDRMLRLLEERLPASLFLRGIQSEISDRDIDKEATMRNDYPVALGLCPSCQKEMFDPSSRRYYYPFTSCACCGGKHAFLERYPYSRENSSMRFIRPCAACEEEMHRVGLRYGHRLNSCHNCAISVRLRGKSSERYAVDAASFRTMFAVAAKAIGDDKRLLVKTTFGYRLFYREPKSQSILLLIDANAVASYCSLIDEEFHALLSIERPILHAALKDARLKELTGYNTAFVKYPDDGFTMLLCAELKKLGYGYIGYEEADAACAADFVMEFDLPITKQEDIRYFINKEYGFIASGERVAFPCSVAMTSQTLGYAYGLVGVRTEDATLFDRMEYFDEALLAKVQYVGELEESIHTHQYAVGEDEASFFSVIIEHDLIGEKCVGGYFSKETSFLYYNGKNIVRAVAPSHFDATNLLGDIATLREGSDRLLENLKKEHAAIYGHLETLQRSRCSDIFAAVATLLDIEQKDYDGLVRAAMRFSGKGGVRIDMQTIENRFDYAALIASIVSYRLAGVSDTILAYSFFESFGDYFSDTMHRIQSKTKARRFVLCGECFGNQPLFSRIERNFKTNMPKMSVSLPIGRYGSVVGATFL